MSVVELLYTLEGGLVRGTRFVYDEADAGAEKVEGWIKGGYARILKDEDQAPAQMSSPTAPAVPAPTVPEEPTPAEADEPETKDTKAKK